MPEALAVAGIKSKMTLYRWLRDAMLPNTRTDRSRFLYSRSDLERIAAGPRNGRGVWVLQPARSRHDI
jgi:predicted site-specific integrase-resolvase